MKIICILKYFSRYSWFYSNLREFFIKQYTSLNNISKVLCVPNEKLSKLKSLSVGTFEYF